MRRAFSFVLLLASGANAKWQTDDSTKRLVLDVTFETSKDYDITSAYAVRGWNTTEGHMKISVPSTAAKHAGRYGMEVVIDKAFTKNFHAQFSLPHFMPRMLHSAYQLTFWAKVASSEGQPLPEVAFLDVDEGYEWVGGAEVSVGDEWQHIAMDPVFTLPSHKGHEIQIAFLIGGVVSDFYFDNIQLYEMDVPSPPPPSPPPPPNYLLWIDGEGGPKGVMSIVKEGQDGALISDLSSMEANHGTGGMYGFMVEVTKVFKEDYYGFLSLPAFLVTDHERMYTFSFWAKATGNPKPRPHITFQDEDNDYAWINGEFVQLSAFWHQYHVNLVVPYKLRGHNVVTNLMLGLFEGVYFFDEFQVVNRDFVSPPPSPPSPPPSPPPNVLLQLSLEEYVKGSINPQAWPEGEMEVVTQSPSASQSGKFGLLVKVIRAFDYDWHAQVSLKPFTPPDTAHGYQFSFWGRAAAGRSATKTAPKVVFQDADDNYTPLKQVSVPLTAEWNIYQVDLSIPKYRKGHAIVINFWVGEFAASYSFDDLEVNIVHQFSPPPPPPPRARGATPPPPPGVVALLGFEGTDDGVTSQRNANNGSWTVSVPDSRAAYTGAQGVYVQVDQAWRVPALAQLLLPRYVPRAGKETLLHLSFYAKAEKMHATDPTPAVTVAFLDLHNNYEVLGAEEIELAHIDWQMHYVVVDLKTEHVGHSIRPYLYLGKSEGIYRFDDFEYQEIEIEDGMEWLQRAPERIKRSRMGKFQITFRDSETWPIDYGTAAVVLRRHSFPLGTTLKTRSLANMESRDYLWYLTQAAQHFWSGSIQGQMQWSEYEPEPGNIATSKKAVDDLLIWAKSQKWDSMSASLFDGGHGDKDHWSNKLTCKDLEQHMHERIMRDVRQFAGKIQKYEVWKDALRWRDWIQRCGDGLYYNAYKWAHQADSKAQLITSESNILSTVTLTKAEMYHNFLWETKKNKVVPVDVIGVQAKFTGEVDASTVKHRLDALSTVDMPLHITEFSISGLDPAKHAYELEKFLRIAFSHESVRSITLGDLWDKGNHEAPGSGLYASSMTPKPAAAKLDKLWTDEWHTAINENMNNDGTLEFEGFYGTYQYELRSGDKVCAGEIELLQDPNEIGKKIDKYHDTTTAQTFAVRCDQFKGHVHIPVWATPALFAVVMVGCLLGCWQKKKELSTTMNPEKDKVPLNAGI